MDNLLDNFVGFVFGLFGVGIAVDILGFGVYWKHLTKYWRERDWFEVFMAGFFCIAILALTIVSIMVGLLALRKLTSVTVPLLAFVCGIVIGIAHSCIPLFKTVHHGEKLPRGYGVAWLDYCSGRLTCMPVPLNVIVRWCRRGWLWIKYAGITAPPSPLEAYDAGYQQAIKDTQDK